MPRPREAPEHDPASSRFQTTRWSVVLAAGHASESSAREALDQLAESYWYPLYAFLRRKGCDREEASDLTQGFFARLLERGDLTRIGPDGGRFRSYLLTSLKHYFLNERDKERARKRGGDRTILALRLDDAEPRFSREPFHDETPEAAFEKSWARSVLDGALQRLEQEADGERFAVLKDHLLDGAAAGAKLAEKLSMTPGAVRVALHRLRKEFARCLRQEVAETVSDPREVEAELQHLLEALGG